MRAPSRVPARLWHRLALWGLASLGAAPWGCAFDGWVYRARPVDAGASDAPRDVTPDIAPEAPAVQLAPGYRHTCARTRDGRVRCWGANQYGQLGEGSSEPPAGSPVTVRDLSDVLQVTSGGDFSCARRGDGTAWCWGRNDHGQLGDGSTTSRTAPVRVAGLAEVVDVAAGRRHACAVTQGGEVYCWGVGTERQIGSLGTDVCGVPPSRLLVCALTPRRVAGVTSAERVAAGEQHSCALTREGTVWCWGRNLFGALGRGTQDNGAYGPQRVTSGLPAVAALAVGGGHTCALTRDNPEVWCWGTSGPICGAGCDRNVPARVEGTTGTRELGAGQGHTCVRTAQDTVSCWGGNELGELGRGNTSTRPEALAAVPSTSETSHLAVGSRHACILQGGRVACWGSNEAGQLGLAAPPSRVRVEGLVAPSQVTAGGLFTCVVERGTGAVRCWGRNASGEVGNGISTVPVATVTDVVGVRDVVDLMAGANHTCARRSDDAVWCWGWNAYGQLGRGTVNGGVLAEAVRGLSNVQGIAVGGHHTCAWLRDGAARCWGYNLNQQLGTGDTRALSAPTSVRDVVEGVTGLAAGTVYTCALRGGAVQCWGGLARATGDTTSTSAPWTVAGLPPVRSLGAGWRHACAVTVDGEVWCWGRNIEGQRGPEDGDAVAPRAVRGVERATAVAGGDAHTCALRDDGAVWCWGRNEWGELGVASAIRGLEPVQVPLSGVAAGITAGMNHTCARMEDARVFCWGRNDYGQLGSAESPLRASPTPARW